MSNEPNYDLSIGELARATGTSVHTLRYYDRAGLIPAIRRSTAGHRRFADEHIRWIGLLGRLRASGMPVARMRDYARLAARGDETLEERKALLREHRSEVRSRITRLERGLAVVDAKLDFYEGRAPDLSRVWTLVEEA